MTPSLFSWLTTAVARVPASARASLGARVGDGDGHDRGAAQRAHRDVVLGDLDRVPADLGLADRGLNQARSRWPPRSPGSGWPTPGWSRRASCPGPGWSRSPRTSPAGVPSAPQLRPPARSSGSAAATGAARRFAGPPRWLPQFTPRLSAQSGLHVMERTNPVLLGQVRAGFYVDCRSHRTVAGVRLGEMNDQARRGSGRTALTGPCQLAYGPGERRAGRWLPWWPAAPRLRGPCRASTARGDQLAAPRPPSSTLSLRPDRGPRPLRKILVIMEENHSLQQIFPGGMPYLWSLAQRYAYATDWSDVAHPSLPNYLAIFAGSAFNDPQDCAPGARLQLSGAVGFRAGSCPRRDGQGLRGIHAAAMRRRDSPANTT